MIGRTNAMLSAIATAMLAFSMASSAADSATPLSQSATGYAKSYVMTVVGAQVRDGIVTNSNFSFYPLNDYAPASTHNSSHVSRLENIISKDLQSRVQMLSKIAQGRLLQSMRADTAATEIVPIPDSLANAVMQQDRSTTHMMPAANFGLTASSRSGMGQRIASLPYMHRRGVSVAIAFTTSSVSTVYEGDLINPQPVVRKDDVVSAMTGTANLARSLFGNVKPMTFDGVAKLVWNASYTIYDVATGQELREGRIGPISVTSKRWQGSWSYPSFGGERFEEVMEKITDPRAVVLADALDLLGAKVDEATATTLNDWRDLLQASSELNVKR